MALQFALNRLFVVTANLGSIFENDEMEDIWLVEFEKVVTQADPDLVALHCQEIGGKEFESSMPKVKEFVKKLRNLKCFAQFDRFRGWFDTDFKDEDRFTALGNLYLFHSRVETVHLWNFSAQKFQEVTGNEMVFSSLEHNEHVCKERFPEGFYPLVKWSRKGFLHTRWRMFGSRLLNFVNIHLFHDDDNLVAMQKSPSVYCGFRRKALRHVLQVISTALGGIQEPVYIYGDFNFRLDLAAVLKHLSSSQEMNPVREDNGKNGTLSRIVYNTEKDPKEEVLLIETKRFSLKNGVQFTEKFKELLQYDLELKDFADLKELPVDFQPSYPFSENLDEGTKYMDKRCPAWCDRILMNDSGLKLVVESPLGCMYNMMAKSTCVGDHKPIYLFFTVASTNPMKELPNENLDA